MAPPPQSETARKLFRVLGRDPGTGDKAPRLVVSLYARHGDGGEEYGRYVDAYKSYLQAVDAVNRAGQFKKK